MDETKSKVYEMEFLSTKCTKYIGQTEIFFIEKYHNYV